MQEATIIRKPVPPVNKEAEAFSERLRQAMSNAGVKESPTTLQRYFNRFVTEDDEVTVHAARKWLMGEAIPTQGKVQVLAKWLAVPTAWLRFGTDAENLSVTTTVEPPELARLFSDIKRLSKRDQTMIRKLVAVMLFNKEDK